MLLKLGSAAVVLLILGVTLRLRRLADRNQRGFRMRLRGTEYKVERRE